MTTPVPVMYRSDIFAEMAESDIFSSDKVYLLTFSMNPKKYYSRDPRKQYIQLLQNIIYPMVSSCFSTYVITPELSENNNIHIHGWFVLKDSIKWHRKWYPTLKYLAPNGVKINVRHSQNAMYYYKKDINYMNYIINHDEDDELPIPLTHINIDMYWVSKRKATKTAMTVDPPKIENAITKYLLVV